MSFDYQEFVLTFSFHYLIHNADFTAFDLYFSPLDTQTSIRILIHNADYIPCPSTSSSIYAFRGKRFLFFFLTNPAAINTYLLEQWVLLSCIKKWDLPRLCAKWNLEVSFQQRGKVSVWFLKPLDRIYLSE